MINNILVVCIGNICRSPMAAGLLKHELARRGHEHVDVQSAGLGALVGQSADELAVKLMREIDIDITGHRARQVNADIAKWANLILVMSARQRNQLVSAYPMVRGKTYRLGEWVAGDIPDPYGKTEEKFREVRDMIRMGVGKWVPNLTD